MITKLYKLNYKGVNCYNDNIDMKNIPPDHTIILGEQCGHNSGRIIYKVFSYKNNQLSDYYFDDCFVEINSFMRKFDF